MFSLVCASTQPGRRLQSQPVSACTTHADRSRYKSVTFQVLHLQPFVRQTVALIFPLAHLAKGADWILILQRCDTEALSVSHARRTRKGARCDSRVTVGVLCMWQTPGKTPHRNRLQKLFRKQNQVRPQASLRPVSVQRIRMHLTDTTTESCLFDFKRYTPVIAIPSLAIQQCTRRNQFNRLFAEQ